MNAVEHLLGAAALERHGTRVALVCRGESLTYRELAARVARSANALRALGVEPGDRVLVLMRDSLEFAATWLGVLHAGAVAVALNTRLSEAEYAHIRADSGARLAIVEDFFCDNNPQHALRYAREGGLAVTGEAARRYPGALSWREACERAEPQAAPVAMDADDPAFWLYSSGTTGRAKGIMHAHRAILTAGQAQREVIGLAAGERTLTTSKLFFAYALEHSLLGPLAIGATALLDPEWPEAETVLARVAAERPVAFFSVPTFYRRLLALGAPRLAPFRHVRRFVAAGERLPAPVLKAWRAATGGEILSLYGMSETFCACIVTPPGTSDGARTGKPLSGVETRLASAEGRDVEGSEPGVLWLRHPALALGYANLPERTAAQFRDGWFCSQDFFVRDRDGYFSHQGRSDELVKIAGQWVQPAELEEAIAAEPLVAESACVPVLDSERFERLALFIAPRGDPAAAVAAATRACAQKLPPHKRPKWVVPVAELPRTPTGKVQRFKLREQLEEQIRGKS
ncbi:MAG TPA: AMP-binding protein [Burkholderiales bacterium]|jgi:benzoate-CoA ligase|nr:AMP-binding protein [Burkholderiales bacterium]